jgi:hypothetical protein
MSRRKAGENRNVLFKFHPFHYLARFMLWRESSTVPAQVKMKYPFKEIARISATKENSSLAIS